MWSPEDLLRALKIVEEDSPGRGLILNRTKSHLFIPEDADTTNIPFPPEIPISRSGFVLLGSPIGPADFCEASARCRVEKIRAAEAKIRVLEDSQMETTLLRSCLSLPKFNFILRSCLPSRTYQASKAFDTLMRDALSDLTGAPLSDWLG